MIISSTTGGDSEFHYLYDFNKSQYQDILITLKMKKTI
jgi:hypothetical protein